jgi:methylmalonyl-CoA mutase, N-terminal domain
MSSDRAKTAALESDAASPEDAALAEWEAEVAARWPERKEAFRTQGGLDVPRLALPDRVDEEYLDHIGLPGRFPFTRGPYPTMYRGRLWTMRMFAGFGTPEDTNRRFKVLLKAGQTGLSTAFDMPTLMGRDPDHALSLGEVGREGVSVATLADMERLFSGIPLGDVTTSMTINGPAVVVLALYIAAAERSGVPAAKLGGTTQADILKEFIAQKEWIVPPRPSMRIIRDMIVFCSRNMPRWHPISISGYHIREAGATAVQELAFTLADGLAYVDAGIEAGLGVDAFAPRLSFFFDVHNDFFEEVAKFRAARRLWARLIRERYGAKNPRSLLLRTHAQTAGVSLTAQQPLNNVARVALQGLAAVLGGTQSLHTNSMDETYALPTEEAARVALRTQQIIAEETGVASTVDPLAGSYFVEDLTDRTEAEALAIIERIDAMGGMVSAVEKGWPQREIAQSAYEFQRRVETRDEVIVGVNRYRDGENEPIPTLVIHPEVESAQVKAVQSFRANRDSAAHTRAMDALRAACEGDANTLEAVLEAVKVGATVGEISDLFRTTWGEYTDPGYV